MHPKCAAVSYEDHCAALCSVPGVDLVVCVCITIGHFVISVPQWWYTWLFSLVNFSVIEYCIKFFVTHCEI